MKCRVFDVTNDHKPVAVRVLAEGSVGGVPEEPVMVLRTEAGALRQAIAVDDNAGGVRRLLQELTGALGLSRIEAVGHRIVHGGTRFTRSVLIDASVLKTLEELEELAPLHNRASLAGVRAARALLGWRVPMVGAFDTAFHAFLPDRAWRYAIPENLVQRHGVRRFGFHGLSYQWTLWRFGELTGTRPEQARIVALHLGNGCSAAAIEGGRSVDTSMGFTPLEGLVMGTRAGDIDPALVGHLSRMEGVGINTVEDWLNTRSGLLGLSGLSPDMQTLLAREADHAGARLAIEVFCYRARKYVGAYLAALGGAQAVVFTGGIGANSPEIRRRICDGLQWFGLRIDPALNRRAAGVDGRISADAAPIAGYAISPDEEQIIARETVQVCEGGGE
ncbi:MAG: acetate/propionate family kinase [Candidatus Methylomirabilis sp.]|nr:acetate/propionate family kinase [Candidatus Methylomirabilis sp.]